MTTGVAASGRSERRRAAASTLLVDGVTAEVVSDFARAGVPCLLLKGPAVETWLYSSEEVRPYIDVDLLVPIEYLSVAEGVLGGLGFRYIFAGAHPVEEPAHARTWIRGDDPSVDLHTGLAYLPAPPESVWTVLSRDARRLSIGTTEVAVPRPAALALIVALRALQRGPHRREAVDELARAVEHADIETWKGAAAAAAELGADGWVRAALGLLPEGAALADELLLGAAPVRAVVLATASYDARACALGLDRLSTSGSWKEKAALLVRAVVPSQEYLRATEGRSGIAIVGGYGRRLRRMGGLVEGYRVWRSAVRQCGANRRFSDRAEVVFWALVARVGLAVLGLNRTCRLLDRFPRRRQGGERLAGPDRDPLFRLAGACLGESVARSQYLRVRRTPHSVVLGVSAVPGAFRSHAWVEPMDASPAGFETVHRIGR